MTPKASPKALPSSVVTSARRPLVLIKNVARMAT
jgi:hypothetical protein